MKCHYDVLEVPHSATEEDIKKSYRKLALKWHPDKNPDNVTECTQFFNLIQQAYDILVDPQERAWYDRHRDAILKGGLDEHYKDDSLNLFPYFLGSCYSAYGDDNKGFYAVYNHVFETLIQEDADFMEDRSRADKIPRFGNSKSAYDVTVGPFYGYWQSYSTCKSYSWLDKHDILQAPNRRVLRLMEKENKKIRDVAKKERNEQVRTLVEFVRKRDKRVLAYRKMLEKQREEQLVKVEAQRISQKLKMLHAAKKYEDAEWHDIAAREDDLKEIELHFDKCYNNEPGTIAHESKNAETPEILDQISEDPLYCVACEKSFKNFRSFENHERSKRHLDNLNLLKTQLTAEEFQLLNLDSRVPSAENDILINAATRSSISGTKKSARKARRRGFPSPDRSASSSATESDDEANCLESRDERGNDDLELPKCSSLEESGGEVKLDKSNADNTAFLMSKKEKSDDSRNGARTVSSSNRVQKEGHCSTCGENFESRNKLFVHLKETRHATLKYEQSSVSERDQKKFRKKRR